MGQNPAWDSVVSGSLESQRMEVPKLVELQALEWMEKVAMVSVPGREHLAWFTINSELQPNQVTFLHIGAL